MSFRLKQPRDSKTTGHSNGVINPEPGLENNITWTEPPRFIPGKPDGFDKDKMRHTLTHTHTLQAECRS